MKNLKRFLHTTRDVFRIYWEIAPGLTLGVLITQTVITFQGVINAFIFGLLIDRVVNIASHNKNVTEVIPFVAAYIIFDLVMSIFEVLNNYFNNLLTSSDTARLRLKQTDLLVSLGISQMENADLTNKSTRFSETSPTMNQHLTLLVGLIAMIISTVAYGVVIYSFAPLVIVVSLVFFVMKYVTNSKNINKIWQLNRDHTEERRSAWTSIGYLSEPSSLKEILISGGVNLLRNKFFGFITSYYKSYSKLVSKSAMWQVFHVFSDTIVYFFGILILVQKFVTNVFSLGTFTFYLRSLFSFSDQLNLLSSRISRAIESSVRLEDALELLELYKPELDGTSTFSIGNTPPEIELSNINFKYPNGKKNVISDLNLTIKSGERIAIVGENGAGKTTLVKLLTRIYRPQEGKITMDANNINTLKKDSLYQKLGVLFQDFNTYGNLSVTENVQMGNTSKKMEPKNIIDALTKADALSFVKTYPKFLEQTLSERFKGGIRPSGGQWQKIAIARFFYRNAPILILDEPTASIDAVSEAQIFDNIYKFMKGKTVIIISHRFSTVRNADRILVLDKGKIIEEGSHEELMKKDGKYAHAFNLQAKGYV